MITSILHLLIVLVVLAVAYWFINQILAEMPGVPRVVLLLVRAIFVLILLLIIVNALLPLAGSQRFLW